VTGIDIDHPTLPILPDRAMLTVKRTRPAYGGLDDVTAARDPERQLGSTIGTQHVAFSAAAVGAAVLM
jgi:hypothetical protein